MACSGSSPNFTAASCNPTDISDCLTVATHDGDIINIPAGTCTWTGTTPLINKTITNSLTIIGAGAVSSTNGGAGTTGTDNTTIVDNTSGGSDPIIFTTTAGKSLRVSGIYFNQNIANTHNDGIISFVGASSAVRFDHNHLSLPASGVGIFIGGVVTGVGDHNYFQVPANAISNDYAIHNGISGGLSNASWANPENFGSSAFWFIEDSLFSGGNVLDASDGARWVLRYSTLTGFAGCSAGDCVQVFSHSTRDGERGDRAREIYQLTVSQPSGQNALVPFNSGTGLVWGNTITNMSHVANLDNNGREDSGTYNQYGIPGWIASHAYSLNTQIVDPNGFLQQATTAGTSGATVPSFNGTLNGTTADGTVTWTNKGANPPQSNYFGYCGPTPISWGTNTASVAAGSTAVTGTGFSTNWPAGSEIIIEGAACTALNGKVGGTCQIASVASSTSLTLSGASASAVTNRPYYVGSLFDQNSGLHGYACLDQPGRGQGNLMSGNPGTGFTPLFTNTVTGTQTWPNQPLIPIYVWDNTLNPSAGTPSIVSVTVPANYPGPTFINDNDYYQQFGTYGNAGTFNGTSGVGQGSVLPTNATAYSGAPNCTPSSNPLPAGATWLGIPVTGNWGPGYWNTTNSTLYICTATNTWTAYYTPYTYPNPLTISSAVLSPSSANFGSVQIGNSSVNITFTLSNNSTVTITGISISNVGGAASSFLLQSTSCGSSLVANASCSIVMNFTPLTTGPLSTTLTVSDSDPTSPQTAVLSGVGVIQSFSFNSASSFTLNMPSSWKITRY